MADYNRSFEGRLVKIIEFNRPSDQAGCPVIPLVF